TGPGGHGTVWANHSDAIICSEGDPGHPSNAPNLAWLDLGTGTMRRIVQGDGPQRPSSITADDRLVVYSVARGDTSSVEVVPAMGKARPVPIDALTRYDQREGMLSPDQQWIAYQGSD